MHKSRFWIGVLGLLTTFMGAQPWLQPSFPFLDFLPSTGDAYSGIVFVLGAITFLLVLFKKY